MPAIFPPDQEVRLVQDFFAARGAGFFVEVGANDPKTESQSWHLEQGGWTGVLIEPLPELAKKLREVRSARVYEVACSSPQRSGTTMRLHVAGAHSSFDPKLMTTGIRPDAAISVAVRTLDEILAEAKAPKSFELLSLDVEGHELDVLRGLNLAVWRPQLILLEDHVTNLTKHFFLSRAGYRLIRRTGLNGWYVPADSVLPLDWRGRWQIIRKYYLSLPFRILRDSKRRLRDRIRLGPVGTT